MQAHKEVTLAKIVSFTLLIKSFPYCCLLIIASLNHNVQFSRYGLSFFFKRLNETSSFLGISVNLFFDFLLLKRWAKMDSFACGRTTAVASVHRTLAKSRLSSPERRFFAVDQLPCFGPFL